MIPATTETNDVIHVPNVTAKMTSTFIVLPLKVQGVYYDETFLERNSHHGKNDNDNGDDDGDTAERFYNELLSTIPWETSSKINRYVYLCQDNMTSATTGTDTTNTYTTIRTTESCSSSSSSSMRHHVHVDEKNPNVNTNMTAAVDTTTTTTTTTAAIDSRYKYRDAPNTSSTTTTMNHSRTMISTTTPDFPPLVRTIGQYAEGWYYQNIQQQQQQGNAVNDTDDGENTIQQQRVHFNVCLLNYYRDGQQRIGFHSDREEIGRTTPVISISLGTTRKFYIRAKSNAHIDKCTISLQSGSLLCMEQMCQQFYVHAIPKENMVTTGRINLTFRCKQMETMGETIHERRHRFLQHLTMMTMTPDRNCNRDRGENEVLLNENNDTDGIVVDTTQSKPLPRSTVPKYYTHQSNVNGWSLASSNNNPSWLLKQQHQINDTTTATATVDGDNDNDSKNNSDGDTKSTSHRLPSKSTTTTKTKTLSSSSLYHVFGDDVVSNRTIASTDTIRYLMKTNLGTECYCAAEINELFHTHDDNRNKNINTNGPQQQRQQSLMQLFDIVARPCHLDGYVGVILRNDRRRTTTNAGCDDQEPCCCYDDAIVSQLLLQLRSVHHVLIYHDHFDSYDCVDTNVTSSSLQSSMKNNKKNCTDNCEGENNTAAVATLTLQDVNGEMIYQYCKHRLVAGTIAISTLVSLNNNTTSDKRKDGRYTFRVSCERIGMGHAFCAPDIEREVGGAIAEYYSEQHGTIVPDMEEYDVHIRADVIGSIMVIGTQLNAHDLSKERHFLRYRNAVTLKTNIAYAMVRCANIQKGDRIADPFCGSGTLLLEALDIYDKQLSCIGLDVSKRSVIGSRKNADAEQCSTDLCQFVCADARSLRRHLPDNSVDAIVSNLPWGVMSGHKNVADLQTMYEVFLRNAWYVLKPNARVVMFVLRGLQVTRIIRKLSGRYRLLNVNVIRTANNLPSIIVIEKLLTDEIRDSIKGQLLHLHQFVNVSPEIYNAIHTETIDET